MAGLIDQIEAGGGGKAVVVVISGGEDSYMSDVTLFNTRTYRNPKASQHELVYKKNGQYYSEILIYFYEIEPSDEVQYRLEYTTPDMTYKTKELFTFNEPKLYILRADDYNDYGEY